MNKQSVPLRGDNMINRHSSELREQLTGAINAALSAQPSLVAYALMDCAFSETCMARYRRMHADAHYTSLYRHTEMDGLADVSPHLIELPSDPTARMQSLSTLLRLANGKPMLSLLLSALDLESLKAHFAPFLHAETEDGQRFILRFGDTRILPALTSILDSEQRATLLGPIAHWWVINRMGQLSTLPLRHEETCEASATTSSSVLMLSTRQFSFLLDAAEPDAIIDQLQLIVPEQCAARQPGDLHRFIDEQLQHATRLGVARTPDRIAYCVAAFNTNGTLHEIPYAERLFKEKSWQQGDLASALAELPDECWVMAST